MLATTLGAPAGWQAYADRTAAAREVLGWMRDRFGWEVAALAEPRGEGWHIVTTVPAGIDHSEIEVGSGGPRAFAASPLMTADGAVVAMVLAFGGSPAGFGPEVEMAGRLLASVVAAPRSARRSQTRRSGVVGRTRFLELVGAEERRVREDGSDVTVLIIDLPRSRARGSGQLVSGAAHELATGARGTDVVGRLGPARIGFLAPGLGTDAVAGVAERLRDRLGPVGAGARVTWCSLDEDEGLLGAVEGMLTQARPRDPHFLICGECGRRGAYVATGHGVLRCKYCRASVVLDLVTA